MTRHLAAHSGQTGSTRRNATTALVATRTVHPGETRRFTVATLTEQGRAHLEASAPGHVDAVRRLVPDPLGDEGVPAIGALYRSIVAELGLPTEPLY